jgi:hypothetical protein
VPLFTKRPVSQAYNSEKQVRTIKWKHFSKKSGIRRGRYKGSDQIHAAVNHDDLDFTVAPIANEPQPKEVQNSASPGHGINNDEPRLVL